MNLITIDPSLSCTAMVVNDKIFVYASDNVAESKSGKLTKWFETVDHLINLRIHNNKSIGTHAQKEMIKFMNYSAIAINMAVDIIQTIDVSQHTKFYIEGYSYSSAAGPLIDLVTFGTLVRHHIQQISGDITVIPPSELKMNAAKFTYPPITLKKNEIIKNHEGVSGGKFKKPEMYKALIENPNLYCNWITFLRSISQDALSMKNVPKPIEDINDAKLMYEIAKTNKYF